MITDQRNARRPRRRRDVLLEAIYELARIECCRLRGGPSPKFRQAVEALEAFDAAEAAQARQELAMR
jgi:hypothetical protein